MARQEIILGALPNGLGGDPPRTASEKINYMTKELYDKNAALGTAAFANTLGSVLNGAIIERGSNANGEFVKFADGTMLTWGAQSAYTDLPPGQAISWDANNLSLQPAAFVGRWESVVNYGLYNSSGVAIYTNNFIYASPSGDLTFAGFNTGNSPAYAHPSFTTGTQIAKSYVAHFQSVGRWR